MINPLAKKITFLSLIKFTAPTVIMLMFISLYSMVDGMFVARFVSTSALSAVNIVYPMLSVIIGLGIMISSGGSAIIAKQMGEGKGEEARRSFSLLVYLGIAIGFAISVLGFIFIKPMLIFLGANNAIYSYCYDYARGLLMFVPLSMLQLLFQFFFVTAGKPNLGLVATFIGGVSNIVLDYLFIGVLQMGTMGAALATGVGFSVPAIIGLIYFTFNRKGTLYFVKPKLDFKIIMDSCTNGSSEMVTNLSVAITTFLFNIMMMKYLGEDGVAAITIVLYAEFFLNAVFLGYSSGVAPIISYNYGDNNKEQLKQLLKISYLFIGGTSLFITAFAYLVSGNIITIFAKEGSSVYNIAKNGLSLFGVGFLFMGLNIFTSSLFTALSNGKVSALLSLLRSFVFTAGSIILLPQLLGVNGLWLAVPIAEVLALAIALFFVVKLRDDYGYF